MALHPVHERPGSPRRRRRAVRARVALAGFGLLALVGGVVGPSEAAAAATPGPAGPVTPVAAVPQPAPHAAAPSGPQTLFVGDYDTGSFGQWNNCQSKFLNSGCAKVRPGQYSMQMVPVPGARQGPFGAHFEVHPGDVPDFGGGERSEVASDAPGALTHEGDERWYHWSMYVPANFTNPRGEYFIVMQWHGGNTSSPPLAIQISKKGTVNVEGDGVDAQSRKPRTLGPLHKGQWVDYALHVGFSRDKAKGFVEGWENGVNTVPRYARATMVDDENYLKQGIYRNADGTTAQVWLDGLRVTGPAGRSVEPRRHPALCTDGTPAGTPCTPS